MVRISSLICAFFVSIAIQSQSLAETPVVVTVQPEDIFLLNGFDNNDQVEVIISGYLPTLCHQSPNLKSRVEGNQILITLTALHYDRSNPFCTQIPIPFLEVINVGVLSAGDYQVVVNRDTPYEASDILHVEVAPTQEQNNFVYAQVEYVEKIQGERTIVLAGTNPSDCLALDRVQFVSNDKNAMAVLPVLKKISDDCGYRPTQFKYMIDVPKVLSKEKILIHVRRMDGKAVNTLFSNID